MSQGGESDQQLSGSDHDPSDRTIYLSFATSPEQADIVSQGMKERGASIDDWMNQALDHEFEMFGAFQQGSLFRYDKQLRFPWIRRLLGLKTHRSFRIIYYPPGVNRFERRWINQMAELSR